VAKNRTRFLAGGLVECGGCFVRFVLIVARLSESCVLQRTWLLNPRELGMPRFTTRRGVLLWVAYRIVYCTFADAISRSRCLAKRCKWLAARVFRPSNANRQTDFCTGFFVFCSCARKEAVHRTKKKNKHREHEEKSGAFIFPYKKGRALYGPTWRINRDTSAA